MVNNELPTKNSAQTGNFGPDILAGVRQKLRSGPPNPEKTSNVARCSCADVDDETSVWKIRADLLFPEIGTIPFAPSAPTNPFTVLFMIVTPMKLSYWIGDCSYSLAGLLNFNLSAATVAFFLQQEHSHSEDCPSRIFERFTPLLGAPTPGLFLAKYSAEKTKYLVVSQPPHQGEEPKRRQTDAKRTLNDALNGC